MKSILRGRRGREDASIPLAAATMKGIGQEEVQEEGKELRVLLVYARWNAKITDALVEGAQSELKAAGHKVVLQSVPGSWELPFAIRSQLTSAHAQGDLLGSSSAGSGPAGNEFDAAIAIGCLIKGETMHFEYIADAVAHGLMRTSLDLNIPVIFGVLTVLNEAQAEARAGIPTGSHNHARDWARAAIEMGRKHSA